VLRGTNPVALAADAAWLSVAAQAIIWPTVGEPVLHAGADGWTASMILIQSFLASTLAGIFGALILRSSPGTKRRTFDLGVGFVALRFTSVVFHWAWLDDGVQPGGPVDFLLLAFMVAMVWSAVRGPEASRGMRGSNPLASALLMASWIPIVFIAVSLWAHSFDVDTHWVWLVAVSVGVLLVRLSVELRQSGQLRVLLHRQATTDPLTELPNRMTLETRVREERENLRSIMIIDLDRFKTVNDQLGHEIGDDLLRQVAGRLLKALTDEWMLSRVGGDEFVAVSTTVGGPAAVRRHAAAAITALEPTFVIRGREAWIGASIGVATVADGVASSDLLAVADLALRQAKRAGRGEVVVSSPELRAQAVDSSELVGDLQAALDNGEIFCLYQPQVDLVSGDLVGVEALVRWHHPERGVLPPSEFLDVAESTGLIARVDEAVLRQAVAQLARWNTVRGRRRLQLSTNMSAWELARRDVHEQVATILALAGPAIDPAQVTVELTETLLIDDPVVVGHRLNRLRSTGVRVSVDDFGSGFTSVAHLREFPISEVKIDRSLTGELIATSERSVAGAVIALAQALELDVVAEGIETREQTAELRRLGCRVGQGFHFSPPVSVEQIDEWLLLDAPFAPAMARTSMPEPN
jgi:diguanylate cyclase (GGDEF)-like protein